MDTKNFYKILEVKENASADEIKEAFRRLSKKTHPDYNAGNPEIYNLFQNINEANQVLSNRNKRLEYDRGRRQTKVARWQQLQKIILIILLAAVLGYIVIDNISKPQALPLSSENNEITTAKNAQSLAKNEVTVQDNSSNSKVNTTRNEVLKATSQNSEKDNQKLSKAPKSIVTTINDSNQKELSEKEMKNILNSIYAEKTKNKSISNCIKIRKTTSSNVENWLMLPIYLREKGFIISGREVVKAAVEGALIDIKGECIVLTIGTFPN